MQGASRAGRGNKSLYSLGAVVVYTVAGLSSRLINWATPVPTLRLLPPFHCWARRFNVRS
jgi:hypothetical protein